MDGMILLWDEKKKVRAQEKKKLQKNFLKKKIFFLDWKDDQKDFYLHLTVVYSSI